MTTSYGEKEAAQTARLAVQTTLAAAQAKYGISAEARIDVGDAAQTAAEVVTAIGANPPIVTSLDGNDGEPATYTFTGGAVGDVVAAVLHVSTKASVATIAVLDPADWTVTDADELTGDGEDYTDDQIIVLWYDLT